MPWAHRGPLSLTGTPVASAVGAVELRLRVAAAERTAADSHCGGGGASALTVPAGSLLVAADEPALAVWEWASGPPLLQLATGSDALLTARQSKDVAPGAVVLDAVGRLNLHVEAGETYSFCVWEPTEELQPLAELDLEARLMRDGDDGDDPRELDAREAVAAFRAQWLGRCCAVGQVAVLSLHDCALRLRCAAADTLDAVAREEAVVYNSFRGIITPATTIFLRAQPDAGDDGIREPDSNGDLGVVTRCGALRLRHCPVRRVGVASAHRVTVYTSDGEWFSVHRELLRPCVALTKAVRATGPEGGAEVAVDIDCCLFDRVLLFLEAHAACRAPPEYDIRLWPELGAAAAKLALRSLADAAAAHLGQFGARLREYTLDELRRRNAAGEVLICVDGMVLDVTRWLPEHPGGSTIIPAQATNVDATTFFELYHASKESFLYIQSFYVGELCAEARAELPPPTPPPSEDFMAQLREYTDAFRLPVANPVTVYKSF